MRRAAAICLTALSALGLLVSSASAAEPPPGPALVASSLATPTNFVPGDNSGSYTYDLRIANLGAAATDGSPITVADTLPSGLQVKAVQMLLRTATPGKSGSHDYGPPAEGFCETEIPEASEVLICTISEAMPGAVEPATLQPGEERRIVVEVFTPASVPEGTQLTNNLAVHGGGSVPTSVQSTNEASSAPAQGGFSFYTGKLTAPDGSPVTQAASHPYQFVSGFAVHTNLAPDGSEAAFVPAGGDIKDAEVTLPSGLVGNPTATPRCTLQQFNTIIPISVPGGFFQANECPNDTAVGMILVQQIEGLAGIIPVPLYNLVPPPGIPAQLGAQILGLPFFLDAEVRPDQGYKVIGVLHNLTQVKRLTAATVVLWGNPADSSHDALRGTCINQLEYFPISLGDCEGPATEKPFLRLPTSCASPLNSLMSYDTWSQPGAFINELFPGVPPTGCDAVGFEPTLRVRPDSSLADSPSGLHVDLHIPQAQHEQSGEIGQADLRDVSVILPPGLVINPAGANGLGACGPAEIDLHGPDAANCPPSSRIGEVEVDTPLLERPIKGGVYVATPYNNPFGSLLSIYIAVDDPQTGVVVKLAGEVHPDPQTGQLTATFAENPQVPFEDFELAFFPGPAAALRTPATCNNYTTAFTITPWSAPASGPPLSGTDSFPITNSPLGGRCPSLPDQLPNSPSFDAGSVSSVAASYSPFVIRLRREDATQEFAAVTLTSPPGLLAKLAGIPYCSEAALSAASGRSGRAEEGNPSCSPASQVGTVRVGAGAGTEPYYVKGKVYLAGPYRGAPLSLAIITPATAGPYDLGTVVVRAALFLDPETARITAVSDPIPRILLGIPLDVRNIEVRLDRSEFTLNPTNCKQSEVAGELTTTTAQSVPLAKRFQVGGCNKLKFKPTLKLRLKGATRHAGHPGLKAVLSYPKKGTYANIARAQVNLPHSEFIDQGNLNKTCTRPILLAGKCPKKSIYGRAKAWTPLLARPLEGPVYLVGGYGYKLPALVAELNGQIRVVLKGKVDSGPNKGIRSTFESIPDAPVSRFVLEMKGGPKYGLLENSENLCRRPQRAIIRFTGQNGAIDRFKPLIANECGKKKTQKRNAKRKRRRGRADKHH